MEIKHESAEFPKKSSQFVSVGVNVLQKCVGLNNSDILMFQFAQQQQYCIQLITISPRFVSKSDKKSSAPLFLYIAEINRIMDENQFDQSLCLWFFFLCCLYGDFLVGRIKSEYFITKWSEWKYDHSCCLLFLWLLFMYILK